VAQLTSEAAIVDKDFTGLRALKDAITKLEHVLQNL
jgi:hypothetical protein